MGVVAGSLFNLFKNKKGLRFLGVLIAVFINAAGYFFTDWLMFSWQGAVRGTFAKLTSRYNWDDPYCYFI